MFRRSSQKDEPFQGTTGEVKSAMEADHKDFQKTMTVIEQLKELYMSKIRLMEERFWFQHFHVVPRLTPAYFDALPMVLLLGQYSVGKTSFIRYLLERDHPGLRVGPEPTTDRFVAVMLGNEDRVLPGNAACLSSDKPFNGLEKYGMDFLNKFECVELKTPILEKISLIDTPGVLAGAKQVKNRGYDMSQITEWFAERCDRVLVLFDAHKLDISDEMKAVIRSLKGNHNKVRIVLNKADQITSKQLMRVYGALMWSLGRVIDSPESLRVFVGSFWEKPMKERQFKQYMSEERQELLGDLRSLPRHASLRKINLLVRRCRYFNVHMKIMLHLRQQFRMVMFKEKKQKELMAKLLTEFKTVSQQLGIPAKDFPNLQRFRQRCEGKQIWRLPRPEDIELASQELDKILSETIPAIMRRLPKIESGEEEEKRSMSPFSPPGGISINVSPQINVPPPARKFGSPDKFAPSRDVLYPNVAEPNSTRSAPVNPVTSPPPVKSPGANSDLGSPLDPFGSPTAEVPWIVKEEMYERCKGLFKSLNPVSGKLIGAQAKSTLMKSGLDVKQLRAIWHLADIDKDGKLDVDEFAVAMYLIDGVRRGRMKTVPDSLTPEIIPPSKRGGF